MKAKLSKEAGGYDLYRIDEDGKRVTFASTQDYKQKLSLKNCQAIERGYDLDELAREFCHPGNGVRDNFQPVFKGIFIQGFQKAIELMGDKKFSEEDVRKAVSRARMCSVIDEYGSVRFHEGDVEIIQSIQQTEWDITFNPDELDADGCIILKRCYI